MRQGAPRAGGRACVRGAARGRRVAAGDGRSPAARSAIPLPGTGRAARAVDDRFLVEPKLRTGIVERGGIAPDPRRYVGIVRSPDVARVRVDPARDRTLSIRTLDGFYVFTLRPGAGRAQVTEVDASGKPIRSFKLPR